MCASVEVGVTGTTTRVRVRNLSGEPTLPATVGTSTGQWVLTSVGFDGIPNSAGTFTTGVGATTGPWWQRTAGSSAPDSWQRFDDKQFGGGVNLDFGVYVGGGVSGGIASSCAPLGSLPGGSNRLWMTPVSGCAGYTIAGQALNEGWFETTFTTIETWDPRGTDVAAFFKGQNGPGGASYECLVGDGETRGNCNDDLTVDAAGNVVPMYATPEPGTVALVATGLLGLLVPVARKRYARHATESLAKQIGP
jgi:hypothetical protein